MTNSNAKISALLTFIILTTDVLMVLQFVEHYPKIMLMLPIMLPVLPSETPLIMLCTMVPRDIIMFTISLKFMYNVFAAHTSVTASADANAVPPYRRSPDARIWKYIQ